MAKKKPDLTVKKKRAVPSREERERRLKRLQTAKKMGEFPTSKGYSVADTTPPGLGKLSDTMQRVKGSAVPRGRKKKTVNKKKPYKR